MALAGLCLYHICCVLYYQLLQSTVLTVTFNKFLVSDLWQVGTPVSSTDKTDIAELLLKVALSAITLTLSTGLKILSELAPDFNAGQTNKIMEQLFLLLFDVKSPPHFLIFTFKFIIE